MQYADCDNVEGEEMKGYRKKVYRQTLKVYGRDKQMIKAIEEMSELQKELCKWTLGADNGKQVQEEIADVIIMMEQMRMLFDVDGEIKKMIAYKVDRLERRLNDDKN